MYYLTKYLFYHTALYFFRHISPKKRTVSSVEKNYNTLRAKLLIQLKNTSFQHYMHGDETPSYSLQRGKIVFGPFSKALFACQQNIEKN